MSSQRIRDPLHDLIVFETTGSAPSSELERTLWKVVQTRTFQRLRRIKQLGFSELVYPGASHSRFSHSIGVFHTAKQLMAVVSRHVSQPSKEQRALAAALVHDVGHGPFSHSFEKVGKRLNLKMAVHENMSDALIREGEIASILNELGSGFAIDVADIIQKNGVKSVQHAVVSSQFDADRLDYMRRDRLMTGTQHSAIDFSWLLANLEIGEVAVGVDDQQLGTVETFVLGPKAIHAAEAFVLGLFQLYPTVYFHKATRGVEGFFTELLVRVVSLIRDGAIKKTGLPPRHPLAAFARNSENVDVALSLDDTVVSGALSSMIDARDPVVSELAQRIRDRKLYKCFDVRSVVSHRLNADGRDAEDAIGAIDKCCAKIAQKFTAWLDQDEWRKHKLLMDFDERSPYKSIDQSKGPLDRINIRTDGGRLVDLKERSAVVAALKTYKLFRVYFDKADADMHGMIERIVEGEVRRCRT